MHKIKILFVVIITFISINSYSQETRKEIDSLLIELDNASDKEKLDLLNDLSIKYWDFSLDSSLYFANEALNLAHILHDQNGLSNAYNRIGNVYFYKNEYERAREFYQKSLEIRIEEKDSKGISNVYNNFASIYEAEGKSDLAIEYYTKALNESKKRDDKTDIASYYSSIAKCYQDIGNYKDAIKNFLSSLEMTEKLNEPKALGLVYNGLGNAYHEISSYDEALMYFLKALDVFKEINYQRGLSMIYNNLGIVYQSLKENDKALEYYKKSLEIDTEENNIKGKASAFNNIGTAYDDKGDKETALEYYNKALLINKDLKNNEGISTALNNIGLIYLDLGEYSKAHSHLMESAKLSKDLNDNYSLANIYNNLANLFLHQKQYANTQSYLNSAIELAKQTNTKGWLLESYDLYSKLYSEQNNYKKALEYYKLYSEVKDSIEKTLSSNRIAEMKIKFETDYIETENNLLKKDNEIHLLELKRQTNIKKYWIAFSILIFALSILSFSRFRLKKKTNLLLETKNNQLKEANKKLTISEHDLKELNATKDKFFSIIAHDLKNPFQSLLGFSESLYNQLDTFTKEEIHEYIRLIYESSQNLFNLLGNLLQWSKSQLGSFNITPNKINLYDSVEDVISLLKITAQNKNIQIQNRIPQDTFLTADKHVVSTVLRNLISNAVKFTNKHGEIIISCLIDDNKIKVSVKDNGKGISPENIEKLFKIDDNYSTKGTENEAGTGLGLILCNELLNLSKGDLVVESVLGKGSDFQFTLPLVYDNLA